MNVLIILMKIRPLSHAFSERILRHHALHDLMERSHHIFYISGKEIRFHFDNIRITTTMQIQIAIVALSLTPCFSNKT
jgi:hypothetical protein